MSETKVNKMYQVTYTDMNGDYQKEMLVMAVNNTIAWELVADYVGIPCKCVSVTWIQSGMYLIA